MKNYHVVFIGKKRGDTIYGLMSKKGEKDKISSKENIRDTIYVFVFLYKIYVMFMFIVNWCM